MKKIKDYGFEILALAYCGLMIYTAVLMMGAR
jgi:hypothetical protein